MRCWASLCIAESGIPRFKLPCNGFRLTKRCSRPRQPSAVCQGQSFGRLPRLLSLGVRRRRYSQCMWSRTGGIATIDDGQRICSLAKWCAMPLSRKHEWPTLVWPVSPRRRALSGKCSLSLTATIRDYVWSTVVVVTSSNSALKCEICREEFDLVTYLFKHCGHPSPHAIRDDGHRLTKRCSRPRQPFAVCQGHKFREAAAAAELGR